MKGERADESSGDADRDGAVSWDNFADDRGIRVGFVDVRKQSGGGARTHDEDEADAHIESVPEVIFRDVCGEMRRENAREIAGDAAASDVGGGEDLARVTQSERFEEWRIEKCGRQQEVGEWLAEVGGLAVKRNTASLEDLAYQGEAVGMGT
jgi:hypothetical protein